MSVLVPLIWVMLPIAILIFVAFFFVSKLLLDWFFDGPFVPWFAKRHNLTEQEVRAMWKRNR